MHKADARKSQTCSVDIGLTQATHALEPSEVDLLAGAEQPSHVEPAGRDLICVVQKNQTMCQRPTEHQLLMSPSPTVPQQSQKRESEEPC